jgi:NADPH:quinone reductase
MRAVVVRRTGVELIETAIPEPAAGQVRIAVAAAGINPVDLATSTGGLVPAGIAAPRDQYGLGWDVAGTVDAAGPGVDLAAGTPVVGLSDQTGIPLKTHADYVILDATSVAAAPRNVSLVEAATLPLNALTAVQALDRLALKEGDSVLVTGAAGGVGGYAVQLAKHRGLKVVATAGPDDEKLVTELGADLFVPRSADLNLAIRAELPGGVDGVVDAAVLGVAALDAVRNHGAFATLIGPPPPGLRGITVHHVLIVADGNRLAALASLVESGALTLRVADTYPLADAATAYARLAEGGLRGRLVLIP